MKIFLKMSIGSIVIGIFRMSLCLAIALGAHEAFARQSDRSLGARQQSVRGSAMVLYQSYDEDDISASQLSIPVNIRVPLGSDLLMSLQANNMTTTGDLEELSGLSDAQLMLSYAREVGSGSIVLSLGANLPTGKKDLTREEFETIILISQRAYDFRVPSLGQGFGLAPSITWAIPVGPNTAVGLGASYQVRSGFRPFDSLEQDYTPGNEILLTGGIDTRVSNQSALSFDISHSIYAADQFGETDFYEAGAKTTISAMYRYVIDFDELRLVGSYRSRAKNSELSGGDLIEAGSQSIPNQLNLLASYRKRLQAGIEVTGLVEGRIFDETSLVEKRSMVDIGFIPALRLTTGATFVSRFVYTLGTISGFEAGGGLTVSL